MIRCLVARRIGAAIARILGILIVSTFVHLPSLHITTAQHDAFQIPELDTTAFDSDAAVNSTDGVASTGASTIEQNDESWWYERIQESYVEKLVHEFKGTSANEEQHDMFRILQPNKQSSMVVQFYSSDAADCPLQCMNLRDHYLQLAMHVFILTTPEVHVDTHDRNDDSGVTESVSFHAVNCANHKVFCQQQQVNHFPTIRLFKHNDETSIQTSYKSFQKSLVTDISYQHLHPYEVLDKLGIAAFDLPDVGTDVENHEALVSASDAEKESTENVNALWGIGTNDIPTIGTYEHRSRKELFHDIHIALDYTMRTLIFSVNNTTDNHVVRIPHTNHRSDLSITEQDVLKSFLMLLQKTMPSSTDNVAVRAMIKAVVDNFIYAAKNRDYMDSYTNEYRPADTQYSKHACPSTVPGESDVPETKYTCVMWDLLLMMSVGMVDFNLQSYDASEMIHPASALHTIFEYVELFGLSMPNSVHNVRAQFIDLYNDCTFMNRCQRLPAAPKMIYEDEKEQVSKEYIARTRTSFLEWKIVPLYLATARNVTVQDPSYDELWPPTSRCSVCWNVEEHETIATLKHDETQLYKYLKIEYGHIDAVTAIYRHELLHEDRSRINPSREEEVPATDEQLFPPEGNHHILPTPERNSEAENPNDPAILPKYRHTRPSSASNTVLTMSHGSICILFLVFSLLQWFYIRYASKRTGSITEFPTKQQPKVSNCELDISHRTVANAFDNDESFHYVSPLQRILMSPKKRQLLLRRVMHEHEKEKKLQEFSRLSSFGLDLMEASTNEKECSSNNSSQARDDLSRPDTPPPPLFKCERADALYSSSGISDDPIQNLRQRKSPLVPMSKPKLPMLY